MVRPDQLGLKVAYVNETAGTHINTRAFLCALRRFNDFLIERSDYKDANPLVVAGYSGAVRELHRSRHAVTREMTGRNAMPASAYRHSALVKTSFTVPGAIGCRSPWMILISKHYLFRREGVRLGPPRILHSAHAL